MVLHHIGAMATGDIDRAGLERGPIKWDGSENSWTQLKFEFVNYARRHGAGVPKLMLDCLSADGFVRPDDMGEDATRVASLLMSDLAIKTTDKAQRLLMNLDEQSNGFEAGRSLRSWLKAVAASRKQACRGRS